jgi:NAD+ diphosphatase
MNECSNARTKFPKKHLLFCGDELWGRRTPGGIDCFFDAAPACFTVSEPLARSPPADLFAAEAAEPPAPDAERIGLRALFDCVPPEVFAQAGLARQLLHWRRAHRFCGACGTPLQRHPAERAMVCPACGHTAYPRINPVVITLVHRDGQLLLVRKADGLLPFWSLVAGFVEANETLEAAVAREIAEEAGLRVKNIRYAASQPWPFPNNLMLGFTAEYAGGDIAPDGEEIGEAGWFSRDDLPPIPARISIARRLIDAFFANHPPG